MYWLLCANFVDHNNFREKQSCRFGGKLPKKSSNKYLTGIFSTVYLILDTDSYLFSNPVSSMVFHQQMPCRYYQHLICPDTISKYRFQDSCLNSQECALKEDLFVACKQILIISPNCKHPRALQGTFSFLESFSDCYQTFSASNRVQTWGGDPCLYSIMQIIKVSH